MKPVHERISGRVALLVLVLLHLGLSLYRLESYPAPWVDEGWIGEVSATIATGHAPGSPSHGTLYRYSDRLYWMPPLYFYGLGGWFALFSVDLIAGRMFNGLIGLLTLLAVFAWGRRRIGSTAAFLAGLVLIFEPFWWKTVRTVRFESLTTLLGFLLIAAIDRALTAEEDAPARARSAWIGAGVLAGLALNVHPNAVLFGAGGLMVIVARAGLRALRRPGPWIALGTAVLLVVPYTLYCLADAANGFANFIGQNSFHIEAGASHGPAILREWTRYAGFYPWPWRIPAAVATAAVLVAAARRSGSDFVKTMLLPPAVILTGLFLLPNKTLLYLVPVVPFTALLAAEWWRRGSRAALAAIAVLVLSGAAVEAGLLARNRGCDFRAAFSEIRRDLAPGDRVAGTFVTWWAAWPHPFHEFSRGATIESVRAFDPSVILIGDRQWTQEARGRFGPLARDLETEFAARGRKVGEAGDSCLGRISIWRLTR